MKKWTTLTALTVMAALGLNLMPAHAAERGLAEGLTAAGIATAAKGNTSQAKELFFKALAHDDNCPDALYELAKIVDKEGDSAAAGDLYQHAALAFALEAKPANSLKRTDAEKRARTLNPVAAKLTAAFEDYAVDLDKIVKKLTDPITETSAIDRVNDLQLPGSIAPDKLPKFYAAAQAAKEKKAASAPKSDNPPPPNDNGGPPKRRRVAENPKAEGATAPEIEKELKALGWATVTGTWVKKSTGVYEATDAKLEAPKTNGVIDFMVLKGGGEGTVKATVRTDPKNANTGGFGGGGGPGGGDGPSESDITGYGTFYRGKDFKTYGYGERNKMKKGGGGGGFGGGGSIIHLSTNTINEVAPKNHFQIKVDDNALDLFYNGSSINRIANTKFSHTGTFVLDVNGTVTLEAPRCSGQ